MPVTPEQLDSAASHLCGSHASEVDRRNAASRSYYGLFHFATRYVDVNAQVSPSTLAGSTHQKLSEYFSSYSTPPRDKAMRVKRVGILLRKCHKARCDADYQLRIDFTSDSLKLCRHDCEQAINLIKGL
ncbi:hypothetical protein [Vreelandella titanicae]|uniref:hypothetical protein n=1 Tax=Vreelandella titanicae TaxID=664683 RepID=UPI0011408FAC|nr:hypothetical protein [Halomonas titanicae]